MDCKVDMDPILFAVKNKKGFLQEMLRSDSGSERDISCLGRRGAPTSDSEWGRRAAKTAVHAFGVRGVGLREGALSSKCIGGLTP